MSRNLARGDTAADVVIVGAGLAGSRRRESWNARALLYW